MVSRGHNTGVPPQDEPWSRWELRMYARGINQILGARAEGKLDSKWMKMGLFWWDDDWLGWARLGEGGFKWVGGVVDEYGGLRYRLGFCCVFSFRHRLSPWLAVSFSSIISFLPSFLSRWPSSSHGLFLSRRLSPFCQPCSSPCPFFLADRLSFQQHHNSAAEDYGEKGQFQALGDLLLILSNCIGSAIVSINQAEWSLVIKKAGMPLSRLEKALTSKLRL